MEDENTNQSQAKFEESQQNDANTSRRPNSQTVRKSNSVVSLPSPPPAIPLPPLPSSAANNAGAANAASIPVPPTPGVTNRPLSKELALQQIQEEQEARIRTIEKHLDAEKKLVATLEEALTDLETQSKKFKADAEAWRRRATDLESENKDLKEKPEEEKRRSLHAVEEERKKRKNAEDARAHLEERMNAINKKKKKSSLNCF